MGTQPFVEIRGILQVVVAFHITSNETICTQQTLGGRGVRGADIVRMANH